MFDHLRRWTYVSWELGPAETLRGARGDNGGREWWAGGGRLPRAEIHDRVEWALFARGQEASSRRSRHSLVVRTARQARESLAWCKKEA